MRPLALLIFDLVAVFVAAILALFLRDNLELSPDRLVGLWPYIIHSLIAATIIFPVVGTNRGFWRYSTFSDFLRIVAASGLIVLAATSATFAYNRLDGLARAVPILHGLLAVALMCALRAAMRVLHGWRSRLTPLHTLAAPSRTEKVLVIGMNAVGELFVRSARQFAKNTIHVVGVLGRNDRHRGRLLHGVSVLGLPDELTAVLRRLAVHGVDVDRIVVAVPPADLSQAARDALTTVEDGSGVVVDYFGERLGFAEHQVEAHSRSRWMGDGGGEGGPLPSLRQIVDQGLFARPYWRAKRAFDFVASLVAIVVMAPVMIVVAVAVAIDVGVPVLFWQERPGLLGGRLRLYKFRTMRSAHDGNGERIPDADRSSLIGRFLRRSRLDELPQLFNILLGEMSFIGPRPLLPVDQPPGHSGRLAVRPGLTGWAQVHGGRNVSPADKAAMDLWYVRNASFRLDLLIVVKTVRMLVGEEKTDAGAVAQAWKDVEAWLSEAGAAPRNSVRSAA